MNRLTFPHLEYMNSCEKICPAYRICYLFSVMIWQTSVSWKDLGYYFDLLFCDKENKNIIFIDTFLWKVPPSHFLVQTSLALIIENLFF